MPNGHRSIALFVLCSVLCGVMGGGCVRATVPQRFTDFSLGTAITITFYDGGRNQNARIAQRLFSYAQDVERRMSTSQDDYRDTELLQSNRYAGLRPTLLSADTFAVVQEGVRLSQLTDGSFQIGIWPLTRLWDFSALIAADSTPRLPSEQEIEAALPLVGHTGIRLDPAASTIDFAVEGMGVDVGGIAKGWVGERFRDELKQAGVQRALIDIGGNIVTVGAGRGGNSGGGEGWRIGIQDPTAAQGEIIGLITVAERSIVTSGDYERFVTVDGIRYHHIIDPIAGRPAENNLHSVTIVSADSIVADALATAVYVQGLVAGRALVDSLNEAEAIFVTREQNVIVTDALRSSFTLQADTFTLVD